jgi:hypothetical protein
MNLPKWELLLLTAFIAFVVFFSLEKEPADPLEKLNKQMEDELKSHGIRLPPRPFYSEWLSIYYHKLCDGWNEDGFQPISGISRDLQIFAATNYGKSDIENGGFHQFFYNSTGDFAPEMVEWFQRAGFEDTAKIMVEAMSIFGESYPRSREKRLKFLSTRNDLFNFLNEPFYNSVTRKPKKYDKVANNWLMYKCNITTLKSLPEMSVLKASNERSK